MNLFQGFEVSFIYRYMLKLYQIHILEMIFFPANYNFSHHYKKIMK